MDQGSWHVFFIDFYTTGWDQLPPAGHYKYCSFQAQKLSPFFSYSLSELTLINILGPPSPLAGVQ